MAKWSGKVFFATSSQANRAMAQGRYPRLPFEAWKPRPEIQRIPEARTRLDGVLVMLEYGLQVMSEIRLTSLAGVLRDELNRNNRRWVPINTVVVQRAVARIEGELGRRQTLLNPAERLNAWFRPLTSGVSWTPDDATSLRSQWEDLTTAEEPS